MANSTTSTKAVIAGVFNVLMAAVGTVSTAVATGGSVRDSVIAAVASLVVGVGGTALTYYVPNTDKRAKIEATAGDVLSVVAEGVSDAQEDLASLYGPEYRPAIVAAEAAEKPAA